MSVRFDSEHSAIEMAKLYNVEFEMQILWENEPFLLILILQKTICGGALSTIRDYTYVQYLNRIYWQQCTQKKKIHQNPFKFSVYYCIVYIFSFFLIKHS